LENRTIKCWGQGTSGQLGNGALNNSASPVTVSGINNAISVSGGRMHACALLSTGSIKCWGKAESGALGNGSTTGNSSQNNQTIPVDVSGISNAINIYAGYQESCAVLDNGSVNCWGAGFGTTPVNISSDIQNAIQVSTWADQAVVLDNGSIIVRDNNGTIEYILGISNAIQVSHDTVTSCAVLDNGSVNCWGAGQSGQLGNGHEYNENTPVSVLNINNAKQVSTFEGHSCAALSDGTVKCWGAGGYGQLGNGATNNQNIPVSVSGIE
jgi:alpha-tubulin suppressor-like RCC1 family protein